MCDIETLGLFIFGIIRRIDENFQQQKKIEDKHTIISWHTHADNIFVFCSSFVAEHVQIVLCSPFFPTNRIYCKIVANVSAIQ